MVEVSSVFDSILFCLRFSPRQSALEGTINQIRLIALYVFLNDNRILVSEWHDKIKGEMFYRPLGGGIEFGKSGEQAVCREIMEELHSELEEL